MHMTEPDWTRVGRDCWNIHSLSVFDFGRGLHVLLCLLSLIRRYVATCYADIRLLRSAFCVLRTACRMPRAAPYALTEFMGTPLRRDSFSIIERITYVRTRCGIRAYASKGGV